MTTCSNCGTEVAVAGRRGRLPMFCSFCRQAAKNARQRLYADCRRYTADELGDIARSIWQR